MIDNAGTVLTFALGQTGCYYGLPKVRERPRYYWLGDDHVADRSTQPKGPTSHPTPSIVPEDEQDRSASRDNISNGGLAAQPLRVGCSKFYADSLADGLTGGLLLLWCPHGVCLGFHVIPIGEGRNDVFSAIYTRFPVAPRVIIYDFACALGPYCMTREALYFANTRFYNDCFHGSAHSKCSDATNLKYAREHDGLLKAIRSSSIAESRNNLIRRITKSVGFMTETVAISYIKLFVETINRVKIRQLI
jgi:hypothetical protein